MFTIVNQLRALLRLANNLNFALSDIADLRDRIRDYHAAVQSLYHRPYPVIVTVRGVYPGIPSKVSPFEGRYPLDDARREPDDTEPPSPLYNEEPGTMGGLLWMRPGEEKQIYLSPQRPFAKLQVEVIGGVIRDIVIGNVSQLIGYHQDNAVTLVNCITTCQVGGQIKITVRLPGQESSFQ